LAVVAVGAVVDAGPTITLRMILRLLILSDAVLRCRCCSCFARNGLFFQLLLLLPLPLRAAAAQPADTRLLR
jgi:hypothetical protein